MTFTPVAPRTRPRPPAPRARVRRRRRSVTLVVAFVALLADLAFALTVGHCPSPGVAVGGAYTPAFDRTLEHAGGATPLTADQIDTIASNAGAYTFSKFSENWNLQGQFQAADKLVAAGRDHGNDIAVYEYFSASFWFLNNDSGWGRYGRSFDKSWYLHDDDGNPVAFHGIGKSAKTGDDALGYVLDLANPAYRAWAVRTVVSWVKAAPLAGINFDSADPIAADDTRATLDDGTSTFAEILCGSGSSRCGRVDAWNEGLRDLLQEATAALDPLGKTVAYNGLNPASQTPDRNLDLLQDADMVNNEDFCVKSNALQKEEFTPLAVKGDIDVMVKANAEGKKVTQITNYQTDEKAAQGPYCLGAFLMGWEPGMDYWTFHENYNDPLEGEYPKFPEVNLNLGSPTGAYTNADGLLTRAFQNGFVMVNTGTADRDVPLPETGVRFADGLGHETVDAGDTVDLAPREAQFFLWSTFLAGAPSVTAPATGARCS